MATDVSEISRARIMTLYPGIRPIIYRVLQDIETKTRRVAGIAQATRTMDEQLKTYAQGRELVNGIWQVTESRKIVTNAKPGMSFHCYGLAWDIAWAGQDPYLSKETKEVQAELWDTYAAIVRSHGCKAGADIVLINGVHDRPHGEMTWGLREVDCLELYQNGGMPAVWAYLDKRRGVPEGDGWLIR